MAKVGERGGRCVLVYIEAETAHAACLGPGCHILTEHQTKNSQKEISANCK